MAFYVGNNTLIIFLYKESQIIYNANLTRATQTTFSGNTKTCWTKNIFTFIVVVVKLWYFFSCVPKNETWLFDVISWPDVVLSTLARKRSHYLNYHLMSVRATKILSMYRFKSAFHCSFILYVLKLCFFVLHNHLLQYLMWNKESVFQISNNIQ